MNHHSSQTPTAAPVVYLPVTLRGAAPFHGEQYEDVEDWVDQYERIARHNGWANKQRLHNLYFSLEGTARRWLKNHEASLTSWGLCKSDLTRTLASQHRGERAENLLQSSTQGPNESVTSFVQDVPRLSAGSDNEETKLRILMRGVKEDIFGGLVRNPLTTVQEFVTEAANMERAILARASHYHLQSGVAASTAMGYDISPSIPGIRDIIREVVREELHKMLPAASRPCSLSLAKIV